MKRLFWSFGLAVTLSGVLVGLQACGVAEGVARLTSPFTCGDGTVVTGRSVYSEPGGERTTSVSYHCQVAEGTAEEITGPVLAVELFYMWLVSMTMVVGVVRLMSGSSASLSPTSAEEGVEPP